MGIKGIGSVKRYLYLILLIQLIQGLPDLGSNMKFLSNSFFETFIDTENSPLSTCDSPSHHVQALGDHSLIKY